MINNLPCGIRSHANLATIWLLHADRPIFEVQSWTTCCQTSWRDTRILSADFHISGCQRIFNFDSLVYAMIKIASNSFRLQLCGDRLFSTFNLAYDHGDFMKGYKGPSTDIYYFLVILIHLSSQLDLDYRGAKSSNAPRNQASKKRRLVLFPYTISLSSMSRTKME
jgi:hypothetical protein